MKTFIIKFLVLWAKDFCRFINKALVEELDKFPTKSDKNLDLKIYIPRSIHLSFLCIAKDKVFEHDILQICGLSS
jgi:hypothetical protein